MEEILFDLYKESNKVEALIWCAEHKVSPSLIKENKDGTYTISITFS